MGASLLERSSGSAMRVLLIEDDWMIGEAVRDALRDASYEVQWLQDGQDAMLATTEHDYDAVLLDLGLPKVDGLNVLSVLRDQDSNVPILIITAREAIADRIHGLNEGADDYLLKPFEMVELIARLRAIGRRRAGSAPMTMSNGIITLDPATHEASSTGERVRLTGREFALFHALMIRPGAILS